MCFENPLRSSVVRLCPAGTIQAVRFYLLVKGRRNHLIGVKNGSIFRRMCHRSLVNFLILVGNHISGNLK